MRVKITETVLRTHTSPPGNQNADKGYAEVVEQLDQIGYFSPRCGEVPLSTPVFAILTKTLAAPQGP